MAEFEDCADGDGSEAAAVNCSNLLENIDADSSKTWWNWLVLVALFAVDGSSEESDKILLNHRGG